MSDEKEAEKEETKEPVDPTTESAASDETKKEESVDYDKELAEEVEKFETAEKNREGYAKRKSKTPEEKLDEDAKEMLDIDAKVADAIKKQMPKLQLVALEDQIETGLDRIASNDAERKLIKFHFQNSVGTNGTIMERLENAKLIANKKLIFKTQKEMAVALNNRQGLATGGGQGTSSEGMEVKDNFLSKDQIKDLKARGWDDKKIQRFKDNLRK